MYLVVVSLSVHWWLLQSTATRYPSSMGCLCSYFQYVVLYCVIFLCRSKDGTEVVANLSSMILRLQSSFPSTAMLKSASQGGVHGTLGLWVLRLWQCFTIASGQLLAREGAPCIGSLGEKAWAAWHFPRTSGLPSSNLFVAVATSFRKRFPPGTRCGRPRMRILRNF